MNKENFQPREVISKIEIEKKRKELEEMINKYDENNKHFFGEQMKHPNIVNEEIDDCWDEMKLLNEKLIPLKGFINEEEIEKGFKIVKRMDVVLKLLKSYFIETKKINLKKVIF
jgi:hypothetical protein